MLFTYHHFHGSHIVHIRERITFECLDETFQSNWRSRRQWTPSMRFAYIWLPPFDRHLESRNASHHKNRDPFQWKEKK